MIDTLMVLWTRRLYSRLLRTCITFLLLLASVWVMLFLVTASGSRRLDLTMTTASPVASPVSTPPGEVVPIILQNPTPRPRATPAPFSSWHLYQRYPASSAPSPTSAGQPFSP